MKKTNRPANPLHIQTLPLQGEQLPSNWREQAINAGGTYDRRDLKNMWKEAKMTKTNDSNITQQARLSRPSWAEMFGTR